jgi:hypothetical protein
VYNAPSGENAIENANHSFCSAQENRFPAPARPDFHHATINFFPPISVKPQLNRIDGKPRIDAKGREFSALAA